MITETEQCTPPVQFCYSRWRHGGWYVHDVRYPSGACGCVSNNLYADKKWHIVGAPHATVGFSTRHDAALAEWYMVEAMKKDTSDD